MADPVLSRDVPPAPLVLVVDDEPQTLKYLPEILGRPCLTATSAAEARQVIGRDPAAIAVVLCDQRMPGESGVEFLAWLRHHHPACIRILCTAYADLTAALAAVNEGAVFQFVLKPFQPQLLRALVNAALEHHQVQRDRDRLLAERLDLVQRQVAADRLHHLATTAAVLAGRLRHPLIALRTFLSHCPAVPARDPEDGHVQWRDLWELAQQDCQRTLAVLDGMVDLSALPPASFTPDLDLAGLVAAAWPGPQVSLIDAAAWPRIAGDAALLRRMFGVLAVRLTDPRQGVGAWRVACETVPLRGGLPGVRLRFQADSAAWTQAQLLALLGGPAGLDDHPGLLAAYVIAFHHGGAIALAASPPEGPGLSVELPLDPGRQTGDGRDPGWIGRLAALPVA